MRSMGLAALDGGKFAGPQNYKNMINDPFIRLALKNNLLMMGFSVVFQVGIALILALMWIP